MQIACAVWALGSLMGTTMTHEVGHSLGLAYPYGGDVHNQGTVTNRLMNHGALRSFRERAEIGSAGPAVLCDEDMAYLRAILPSSESDPLSHRPVCCDAPPCYSR